MSFIPHPSRPHPSGLQVEGCKPGRWGQFGLRAGSSAGASGTWVVVAILAFVTLAGLGAWSWRRANPRISRAVVAVLPFDNVGRDPGLDYLADGLADEAIAALERLDPARLRMIGRASVMTYKRSVKSLREIGEELGADYVVESSIRSDGSRLRVRSRLVLVRDQFQVWSASSERDPNSMLGVQRELDLAVAEAVGVPLPPERRTALERRYPASGEAYDLYLRGRHSRHQPAPGTIRLAIEYFERATAVDRGYALAWAGLAEAHAIAATDGDWPPLEVWPRAAEAASRAIAADHDLAESQASLGLVKLFLDWDWPAAEAAFRRAIALDPVLPIAHTMLGVTLSHLGRHEEAEPPMRRARELDPLDARHPARSAAVAFHARHHTAAVRFAEQAVALGPDLWPGYFQLAQGSEQVGQAMAALEPLAVAARLSGGHSRPIALRGYVLARIGRTSEARMVLARLEDAARYRYVPPSAMALVSAGLGRRDAALDWLEMAYEAHDVHLMSLPVDPKWDPFRSDPRFRSLLDRSAFSAAVLTHGSYPEADHD